MVKSTFAFVFLTLASIFALVSAVPAAPSYSIMSGKTARVIVSDGTELEGSRVMTILASKANSDNSFLTIKPLLEPGLTISTVQGKAGLYITAVDYPKSSFLVWRKVPFSWKFSPQPPGAYIISAVDKDGYWSNDPNSNGLLVEPGYEIATLEEMYFRVTSYQ